MLWGLLTAKRGFISGQMGFWQQKGLLQLGGFTSDRSFSSSCSHKQSVNSCLRRVVPKAYNVSKENDIAKVMKQPTSNDTTGQQQSDLQVTESYSSFFISDILLPLDLIPKSGDFLSLSGGAKSISFPEKQNKIK